MFFCLSSFTLFYVYHQHQFNVRKYLCSRFARIVPLYAVTLIAALVPILYYFLFKPAFLHQYFSGYTRENALYDGVMQLFMVNDWPIVGTGMHWNTPAWSLSIEVFCYVILLISLIGYTTQMGRMPTIVRAGLVIAVMVTSIILYALWSRDRLLDRAWFLTPITGRTISDFPFVSKADWVDLARGGGGFIAGWLTYISFDKKDGLERICVRYVTLTAFGIILVIIATGFHEHVKQLCVLAFPFLILGLTSGTSTISRLLENKVLYYIGRISYSIYMWHYIVLAYLYYSQSSSILYIPIVAVLSVLSYRYIEIPARDWLRPKRAAVPALGSVDKPEPSSQAAQ